MDDSLDNVRERASQQNAGGGASAPQMAGAAGGDQGRKAEEQKKQEADMKNSILAQVLEQSARARLNTLALAKPDKARMVENMVIQMATRGQINSRLSEDQFVHILSQVNAQTKSETTVKFDRRRVQLDDDDDDDKY